MTFNSLKDIYLDIKELKNKINYNEAHNEIILTKEDYEIL